MLLSIARRYHGTKLEWEREITLLGEDHERMQDFCRRLSKFDILCSLRMTPLPESKSLSHAILWRREIGLGDAATLNGAKQTAIVRCVALNSYKPTFTSLCATP